MQAEILHRWVRLRRTPCQLLTSQGTLAVSLVITLLAVGCSRSVTPEAQQPPSESPEIAVVDLTPRAYEATGDQLLAARLSGQEHAEGWIRLFDGHTLFGWEITGQANWRVEEEAIVVDSGDVSLLCTSIPWKNYELTLQFNAEEDTNSGVFLRTPLQPDDPAIECYEINIASDDNPYPTGSVVERQKVDSEVAVEQSFGTWRTMKIRLEGRNLQVTVDGQLSCEYSDLVDLPAGRIGLQKNVGRVAFRDIRLRPIGLESMLADGLDGWKEYPEMEGAFSRTEDGSLQVLGGKTQLETEAQYGDFTLLAEYRLDDAKINSGLFFRCIPGDEMMGYECQVSNDRIDGLALRPADCGSGGIFRRQDARVVAGETGEFATILLTARGPHFAAWVNGVQVSDFVDDRPANENPRRGRRLEPGTIIIQGHDPTTDVIFRQLQIVPF